MSRDEIIKRLRSELVDRGLVGRGRNLHVTWAEVAWMIHLELIPRTSRTDPGTAQVSLAACS